MPDIFEVQNVEETLQIVGSDEGVVHEVVSAGDINLTGTVQTGGLGYLFVSDGGADQIIGPVASALRNNGASVINQLKAPFIGASLVDANGVFTPRAVHDVYRLIVRVTAAPSVINTDLTLQLNIGGSFGVIETDRHRLSLGAGVEHQETFIFPPFTGATFVANGGTILASADSEVTIKSVDYRVFPESVS